MYQVALTLNVIVEIMHDDAPAHFSSSVRDFLNDTSHGQQINIGGYIVQPTGSAGLNSRDTYL
jgi:hypothetical protein